MASDFLERIADREIVKVRDFRSPKTVVFDAWANPDRLVRWWGPKGFTNTSETFDLRAGGKWKFVMHGPSQGHYPNECVFLKVIPGELIVWNRISNPLFQVHVLFTEITPVVTRLTFQMLFKTAAECDKLKKFVVDKNEENFDKLEVELNADSH